MNVSAAILSKDRNQIQIEHQNNIEEWCKFSEENQTYNCKKCSKFQNKNPYRVKLHFETCIYDKKKYDCKAKDCNSRFTSRQALARHKTVSCKARGKNVTSKYKPMR